MRSLLLPLALLLLAPATAIADMPILDWRDSTVRMEFGLESTEVRVVGMTITMPERFWYPWWPADPYRLRFGDCPPEGYCRPPFAVPCDGGLGNCFPDYGWTPSWSTTHFRLEHERGVVGRQTLYLNDPISWNRGPTWPWDMREATVTYDTVAPEPVSMALLATGLAGVGALRRRRHGLHRSVRMAASTPARRLRV
jgi:hypothetical protein